MCQKVLEPYPKVDVITSYLAFDKQHDCPEAIYLLPQSDVQIGTKNLAPEISTPHTDAVKPLFKVPSWHQWSHLKSLDRNGNR